MLNCYGNFSWLKFQKFSIFFVELGSKLNELHQWRDGYDNRRFEYIFKVPLFYLPSFPIRYYYEPVNLTKPKLLIRTSDKVHSEWNCHFSCIGFPDFTPSPRMLFLFKLATTCRKYS